jgi:hypothetical protein
MSTVRAVQKPSRLSSRKKTLSQAWFGSQSDLPREDREFLYTRSPDKHIKVCRQPSAMHSYWAIDFSPHRSSFYHAHPQVDEPRLDLFDEQDGGNRLTNQNRSRGYRCDFPSGDLSYRRWGHSMASLLQSLAQSLVVTPYPSLFLGVHTLMELRQ